MMRNILLTAVLMSSASTLYSKPVSESEYHGWKSIRLKNEFNSLQITPDLGGRIIQLEFNGAKLFWENSQLYGKSSPETGLDEDGEWMNYGGEKLWPAPQGWDNEQQWHGPPDPVLDGGVYHSEIREGNTVYLRSKVDPVTGIRFERTIQMIPGSSGVAINATMTNESKKDVRWGIWSNAQLDASVDGERNEKFKVYCPINPDSKFVKGYGVLFGLVNNPQWQAGDDLMTMHYMHHVGKAVLDSPAGWLASVNGETGNVFVQMFEFDAKAEYPDHSSVAVWTMGLGSFYAWGKVNSMADDTATNPYLVESETLSPYTHLKPGEKYGYNYKWFTANIGGDYPVIDVKGEILVSELSISGNWIKARLASFRKGEVVLSSKGKVVSRFEIAPTKPLVIDQVIEVEKIELYFISDDKKHTTVLPVGSPQNQGQWNIEKINGWYADVGAIKGCNYLPATAVNDIDMWQESSFDPETIGKELKLAHESGYNSVRVFLHYLVWKEQKAAFKKNIETFLKIADRNAIKVMFILFDDCNAPDQTPFLGAQESPKPGHHNSRWVACPGLDIVDDKAQFGGYEKYLKDVISSYKDDGRVIAWDLYNEPGNTGVGTRSKDLLLNAFKWAREVNPSQPLTVGAWNLDNLEDEMSQLMMSHSDFVTFHSYKDIEDLKNRISVCKRFNRPIVNTEWLRRQAGNTFEVVLPVFEENEIGWYHWGLVQGKTQTWLHWVSSKDEPKDQPWQHDIFTPDHKAYDSKEIERIHAFNF